MSVFRGIRNKYWSKRHCILIGSAEMRLRVAEVPQPQPQPQQPDAPELARDDVPELARDDGLQQIRQRQVIVGSSPGRHGWPNDHQSPTREYLEETGNPDYQIFNSTSTTDEEIRNPSFIITSLQRRENRSVEDDPNNITGNHVEAVWSDGIARTVGTPAPRQATFRWSSSTEIAGGSKKDRVPDLGGMASERLISQLDLQLQSQKLLLNDLNLVKFENQELSRRIGEMETKIAVYEQYMSMLSSQQYPTHYTVSTGTIHHPSPTAQVPYLPPASHVPYSLRGEQSSLEHHPSSHQLSDSPRVRILIPYYPPPVLPHDR